MTATCFADVLPAGVRPGDQVTAKRDGWDDDPYLHLDADVEPHTEAGYDSDDLTGTLDRVTGWADGPPPARGGWLVGGQPADPRTVRPA